LILWECPVIILKGTTDRRKQENHLVSVVTEAAVLAHIRNVLVNADDPSQAWRQQLKFDEWRQQQRDLVGPKGKAIKKQAAPKKKQAGAAAAAAAAALGATTDSGTAVAPARTKRQTGPVAAAATAAAATTTDSGTAVAPARKKRQTGLAAAAAAAAAARNAPARLELPFKLDRANMAALLATPAQARTARFQDTMLYSDDSEEGVRCIVVRASVIASMNSTHYVTRIVFTENMQTGRWEATKQMKNCQCVSGSELERLWCTHMAGVFVALAKLVRNRNRSLDGLKTTWPEDIVLLQSQPVRLSLVVGRRAFARSLLTNRAY